MIIDSHHHHLGDGPGYADKLAQECFRLGIKQVWLMGLPEYSWPASTNEKIQKAFEKYPGLMLGFGWIELGVDRPGKVNELKGRAESVQAVQPEAQNRRAISSCHHEKVSQ